MAQYQCADVAAKDHAKISALIAPSLRYQTLLMRDAAAQPAAAGGWWYGAWATGELYAIAWINNNFVHLYGTDSESLRSLGASLVRAAGSRVGSGTHQVFGPESMVDAFWESFKLVKRTLVADVKLELFSMNQAPACPEGYAVNVASAKDQRLVEEFSAEHAIEEWAIDPRRSSKAVHEQACKDAIAAQTALVGSQRGKAVFYGSLQQPNAEYVWLERVYVPLAFRRPRVMAGVLAHATALALSRAPEMICLLDRAKTPWMEAAQAVGYASMGKYRLLRLR